MNLKSMMIASLPRSLSSEAYRICARGLSLKRPNWVSDGEILNLDRHVLSPKNSEQQHLKYISPGEAFDQTWNSSLDYLNCVFDPVGHIYKDVVQPYLVTQWLNSSEQIIPTLVIIPDIAHVSSRMMDMNWLYPAKTQFGTDPLEALVRGLIRAYSALSSVPGERLHFNDLSESATYLWDALSRLYPDHDIRSWNYIDKEFEIRRRISRSRRFSKTYMRAEGILKEIAGEVII